MWSFGQSLYHGKVNIFKLSPHLVRCIEKPKCELPMMPTPAARLQLAIVPFKKKDRWCRRCPYSTCHLNTLYQLESYGVQAENKSFWAMTGPPGKSTATCFPKKGIFPTCSTATLCTQGLCIESHDLWGEKQAHRACALGAFGV